MTRAEIEPGISRVIAGYFLYFFSHFLLIYGGFWVGFLRLGSWIGFLRLGFSVNGV